MNLIPLITGKTLLLLLYLASSIGRNYNHFIHEYMIHIASIVIVR